MIVSNMEIILGKHIKEHLGLVQGGTVRTKHFGREFLSSHPDTEHRIQHLNQLAQTQNWRQQGRTRSIPGSIINKLAEDSRQAKQALEKIVKNQNKK